MPAIAILTTITTKELDVWFDSWGDLLRISSTAKFSTRRIITRDEYGSGSALADVPAVTAR